MNRLHVWCLLAGLILAAPAVAHEGHAALPSKGVTVAGERLYLSPGAVKSINLQTAKVALQDVSQWIRANASIELAPKQRAKISTLVAGRVDEINVKPGESVRVGQPIVRLHSPELEAVQLEFVQASEAHSLAERLLKAREDLVKTGATPAKLIIESQTEHQQSHARLEIALQKLTALGISKQRIDSLAETKKLDPTIILTSPIEGTVAHVDMELGQNVETNEHLAEVVNLAEVYAVAQVLESDASLVRPGMPITVTFASRPADQIEGVIESVGVSMDAAKRVLPVRIRLDNKEGWLRPGMFGRVAIKIAEMENAVVAPRTAIVRRGGRPFVLMEESDRKYLRKPVRLGVASGDVVEVLEGAFPGHRLVTTGSHELEALLGNPPAPAPAAASGQPRDEKSVAANAQTPLRFEARVELPNDQRAVAMSRVAGRITAIRARPGQQVKRGDVLIEIESVDATNAQLSALQTHLQLQWARRVQDRLRSLQGVESEQGLWKAESEAAQLSNQLSHQVSKLGFLGFSEERIQGILGHDIDQETSIQVQQILPVRAPLNGWLTELNAVVGQAVMPNQPLAEIQNPSQVWVRGYAFENEAASLAIGQAASIHLPNDLKVIAQGKIERISPSTAGSARALSLWVPIDNPDLRLKPGQSVILSVAEPSTATPIATGTK